MMAASSDGLGDRLTRDSFLEDIALGWLLKNDGLKKKRLMTLKFETVQRR